MDDIEWRLVPDYPMYAVSEDGKVKNLNTGKILRPNNPKDYPRVHLGPGTRYGFAGTKKRRLFRIHRLVCFLFNGPPPPGKRVVAHRDGSRDNNHFRNLRWATDAENKADDLLNGSRLLGAQCTLTKFSPELVLQIFHAPGKQRDIAAQFGTSQTNVSCIKTGRSWSHLTGMKKLTSKKKP